MERLRDRLCPVCRGPEAHDWLEARQAEVLPDRYVHAVVTVPTVYRQAVRDHPQRLGSGLMAAVAEALQEVAGGPHGPGGELGILAVLHTWGRNLPWHAHVHCLIPGVVLQAGGTFEPIRTRFLVPLGASRKVFPAILTRRFRKVLKGFDPPGRVWRTAWNVRIRPCEEGPGGGPRRNRLHERDHPDTQLTSPARGPPPGAALPYTHGPAFLPPRLARPPPAAAPAPPHAPHQGLRPIASRSVRRYLCLRTRGRQALYDPVSRHPSSAGWVQQGLRAG